MKVELQNSFPLWNCSNAIRECHSTKHKSDTSTFVKDTNPVQDYTGEKDKTLIERVGNKMKHASTLEHLQYTFSIDGVSRALLQELARHRMASLTVKSTRYTLKELKNVNLKDENNHYNWKLIEKFIVMTSSETVNNYSAIALMRLQDAVKAGVPNDIAKFCMPESYKTSLTWTINARSLQNFISLRTHNSALWEIQNLANAVFEALPEEHKYLFENFNHIMDKENAEN